MPILYKDELRQIVQGTSRSPEGYSLVAAFCAFMLIQPGIVMKAGPVTDEQASAIINSQVGSQLMEDSVRVRKGYDYIENPTIHTAITSFFLFGCFFGLNKHNTAWSHLREATAIAQILGLQDENTYMFDNVVETSRRRRLFWLLFVTERQVKPTKHVQRTMLPNPNPTRQRYC